MAHIDDEASKPKRAHEIGQDLSQLSVDELAERVGLLNAEIKRLQTEIDAKGSTMKAAEALFQR